MHGRIPDIWLKVKLAIDPVLADWGLIFIVFLVALSSFGMGRLSAQEAAQPAVSAGQAPMEGAPKGMAVGGLVVASKTGTVYQYPWCGTNIKPGNMVWFASEEAAVAAGYKPSKSCKGLSQ